MNTLYFAYGSNMDREQMRQRCPEAAFAGTASLPGYMFIINDRGVATVIPKADASVPGVVWQLSNGDESASDRYEGYRQGLYDKCFRTVADSNGNTSSALVYIGHINTSLGASRDGYLDRIIQAAEANGLPEGHLNMLRMWPAKKSFHTFNQLVNEVKSGGKDYLVRALKDSRDELILETLYQAAEQYGEEDFDALLENTVHDWVREQAHRHELERAAACFLEHTALKRFIRYVDSLKKSATLMDTLGQADNNGEVAGLGVIITSDPARIHGPEHRFIVTAHAPLLSDIWYQLFSQKHGVHARTCRFMELFADIAETCDNQTPQEVVERILDGVQQLALTACNKIADDIESVRL